VLGACRVQVVQLFPDQPSAVHSAPFIPRHLKPHPVSRVVAAWAPSGLPFSSWPRSSFPATYTGLLTHRGTIVPSGRCTVGATLRARTAGQYALTNWKLEIDVGEQQSLLSAEWTTRARYSQEPPWSEDSVLVRNAASSA